MKIKINPKYSKYLLPMHPVVIITTVSNKGLHNAGVYATLIDISYNPPLVIFASNKVQHKLLESKTKNNFSPQDTYLNIKETRQFIVNVPGRELMNNLKFLAYPYPRGIDEIEKAHLTKLKPFHLSKNKLFPYFIKECLAHLECNLLEIIDIPKSDHFLIIGEVISSAYDSKIGKTLKEVRVNLTNAVFGNLHAINKRERLFGRIVPFKYAAPVYKSNSLTFKIKNGNKTNNI